MALDPTPIRRCVCGNVTFEELQEEGVQSLEEAQERLGAALYCETCVPYILRMLATGQTAFPVAWEEPDPGTSLPAGGERHE